MVENVTNTDFFVILKLALNVLECHFFCVWSMDHITAWNEWIMFWDAEICFRMILWCFIPAVTTHFFLWEKIAPFGCDVVARLKILTTGFEVCLWQSLNNSSGHLSYTQRHRMTIENLFLDGQVHTLFSENQTMSKLHCQRWNACFPVYLDCLKIIIACKLNC